MVQVTKAEKVALEKAFPDVRIVRTMKHDSKRSHYFCPEESRLISYLRSLRVKNGVIL